MKSACRGRGRTTSTMYILAAMLVFGLIANALVKPLSERWFMTDEDLAALQARGSRGSDADQSNALGLGPGGLDGRTALAWTAAA